MTFEVNCVYCNHCYIVDHSINFVKKLNGIVHCPWCNKRITACEYCTHHQNKDNLMKCIECGKIKEDNCFEFDEIKTKDMKPYL